VADVFVKGAGQFSRYSDGLRAGRPGFNSRQGQEIFLYSIVSTPALRLTQPPIHWAPGAISPGVKRPGREVHQSSPSSAEVKYGGTIPLFPNTSSRRGAWLIKHKDNFTFTWFVDLLKRSGHFITIRFNTKRTLQFAHTVYLCVSYECQNNQRPFPTTTLTGSSRSVRCVTLKPKCYAV
jgi:hypothetical protein